MKNIIVAYKSEYGYTKKYAEWIGKKLNAKVEKSRMIKTKDLEECDTLIYGGGLYAGDINGISFVTKHMNTLKGKNIIVFIVGLADQYEGDTFQTMVDKNIPKKMQDQMKIFHFRGGIELNRLGFKHRMMMTVMLKALLKKPEEQLTQDDLDLLKANNSKKGSVDYSLHASIVPLVEYVKNLDKE